MSRFASAIEAALVCLVCSTLAAASIACAEDAGLMAGFAARDITPELRGDRAVWLAGYGTGRRATGLHDPLFVRCVVLKHADKKIAVASVDLVGLQYAEVLRIRQRLDDFAYVLVASTHNHEGPDVIGMWGKSYLSRGVDDEYLTRVVDETVAAIRAAGSALQPVSVEFGTAEDESLLGDSRQPYVKDGVLRTLRFVDADRRTTGLLVQWNCHPEALGSRNTQLTADFPWATIQRLNEKYAAPVVYFSGAVGGLMAPPRGGRVRDDAGEELKEVDFEYARRYGELVAELAARAIENGQPLKLMPFAVASRRIAIPLDNPLYKVARELGVMRREALEWTGDANQLGKPIGFDNADAPKAVATEVAALQLGELTIVGIPGELYPELVYGAIQTPADPNADFPDAPAEPSVASLLPDRKWLLFGLANDEIGYIIPRRQWDEQPPFAYGRTKSQYGEINSCGPRIAPIVMQGLADCIESLGPR